MMKERLAEMKFMIAVEEACKVDEHRKKKANIFDLCEPDHLRLDFAIDGEQMVIYPYFGGEQGICLVHEVWDGATEGFMPTGNSIVILRKNPEKGIRTLKAFIAEREMVA